MEKMFPNLCSPIKIGGVEFKNRMFGAPMGCSDIQPNCAIGDRGIAFYEPRARGGAAAVVVSEVIVDPTTDGSHALHLDLETPGTLSGLAWAADRIMRHGCIPSVELSHSGQYAGNYFISKERKNAITQFGPDDGVRHDGVSVRALTKEQIEHIVESYGRVAGLAKRAGFKMVLLHAGHGWLLNQFLSPYFNHRKDEYGGTLENRTRIVLEALRTMRAAVGRNFPIEVRMSGSEEFDGGYDIEGGCRIAELIQNDCDMIHVSAGSYQFGFEVTHPSMFKEHGCNVPFAAEIKKHVSIPVATLGGLGDPYQMEEIIASGKADVVYMARQLLADPELPNKVMAGKPQEIVKCLRCFTCMAERVVTQNRRCAVNPIIGRETEGIDVAPAARPKKVLVAGGGVGGMQAAVTAAKRGHSVILCEKTGELGGILKSEQAIDFKREMYELGLSLASQMKAEGVDVRLNTEVTPKLCEELKPDAIIVAVGSSPLIPPVKGIDDSRVITVNDYYLRKDEVGDTVAVVGGGLAGSECAVHLAGEGKKAYLIEMQSEVAPDANPRHRPILLREIDRRGVIVCTKHTVIEVRPDGVLCRKEGGEEVFIAADTVICAAGQRANRSAALALAGCAPFVREIGDCIRPANITTAVYQGHHAALDVR